MTKPFTVQQLADRWQCSPQSIRNMITSEYLKAIRYRRLIRIPYAVVEEAELCGHTSDIQENGLTGLGENVDVQPASPTPQRTITLPNGRRVKSLVQM